MNYIHDSRPTLDAPMAAVLSTLGKTSSLMSTAKLGNLDNKEYSVYLNSSITKSTKQTA